MGCKDSDMTEQLSREHMGFPGGSEDKASACNAGDPGSIPGLERSPGEGNGNPLQGIFPTQGLNLGLHMYSSNDLNVSHKMTPATDQLALPME